MKDAMRMVRAKVESTRNMYNRANSAPNNCPGHQPAVLGQRILANPSAGALQSGTPARMEYASAPFHFSDAHGAMEGGSNGRLVGGVLRSAQGQAYGKSLLNKRINDFNAIDAEQMKFTLGGPGLEGLEGMPQPQPGQRATRFVGELPSAQDELGLLPSVELAQLLQNVLDSVNMGMTDDRAVSRFTVGDSTRAFSLIVRLASTGTAEDIADILEFLDGTSAGDGIIPQLRMLTQRPVTDEGATGHEVFLTLLDFWQRVAAYLKNMIPLVGRPLRERAGASQAYIKSLKFTKIFKSAMPEEFATAADAQESVDVRRGANFRSAGPGAPRGDEDDDDSSGPSGRRGASVSREDSQHGYFGPGSEFSYDDRQRFGYSSGEYSTGGRPVGYSGVAAVQYGDYASVPQTVEEEDGEEAYLREADSTVPGNAGPRLTSSRSAVTGEYDVFADSRPQAPTRRVSQPAGRTRSVADSFASLRSDLRRNPPSSVSGETYGDLEQSVADDDSFGSFQYEPPLSEAAATARSRASSGRSRASAPARSVATASTVNPRAFFNRHNLERLNEGLRQQRETAAAAEAAPVSSRGDLPNTIPALRALAERINTYYGNQLPDGRGPLRVRADSKVRSVKLNMIRRLGL
jgi:hypothetical protein